MGVAYPAWTDTDMIRDAERFAAPLRRPGGDRPSPPDADLAVLHLGGTTLPGGFVVTMDGGTELARRLDHPHVLPVHHDDYTVFHSPLDDFLTEARALGLQERLVPCRRGQHARVTAREERPTVR
ncbi:hypothetical protein Shyhy01_69090 [Streptomyces hygroscopicus subsp. hygroscopicus]|nr:hypothetical protein Shyhy01_69090 [Streptomyces hygroscopicus subsp. hygroscopicus]